MQKDDIKLAIQEMTSVRIELMLVGSSDFPSRLLDAPAREILKYWMDRDIHPIGVIEQFDQLSILGIGPKRQLLALIDGQAYPIEAEDAGMALFNALDLAAFWLWGHAWNSALGDIFGINRRTTQRDRVGKNLLPPKVLYLVAHMASRPDGQAMAAALQAVAAFDKTQEYRDEMAVRESWQFVIDAYYGTNKEGLQVIMKD